MNLTQKLISVYKIWHELLPGLPKTSRYTLGAKIDDAFLAVIEHVIKAGYSDKTTKYIVLSTASVKLDVLKFFLQMAWEIKSLDNKKYIRLSEKLNEVGKMLGGWIKAVK